VTRRNTAATKPAKSPTTKAEEQRELHIAHAHSRRIDQFRQEQEGACSHGREDELEPPVGIERQLASKDDRGRRQHDSVRHDAPFDVDRRQHDEDTREESRDQCLTAESELEKADGRDEADSRRGPRPVAG
jgi:hypothetical protein